MRKFALVNILFTLAVCLFLLNVFRAQIARAEVRLDQATQDYLEGSWLIGEKPVRGPCTLQAYSASQIEFEFRNSGGRLTLYEPFDLFTPVRISAAEQEGDVLSITLDGRKNLKMQIPVRLQGRTGWKFYRIQISLLVLLIGATNQTGQ